MRKRFSKRGFYNRDRIRWVEVTNETAKSPEAVRAFCQALAISTGSSHPERVWSLEEVDGAVRTNY